jgi:RNA polymerase-binding transcription factor DksA
MTAATSRVLAPETVVILDGLLHRELDEQRLLVADAEATIRELTGSGGGDAAHERDIAERAMNRAIDIIGEIEHAIERVSTTTYGSCEGCGTPIPASRLEAIPYARTCVHCPPPDPLPRLG